jgi:hypothetical protein
MTSAKRHEAQSPARLGGVAGMDDSISTQITREVARLEGVGLGQLCHSRCVGHPRGDRAVPLNVERPWMAGELPPD